MHKNIFLRLKFIFTGFTLVLCFFSTATIVAEENEQNVVRLAVSLSLSSTGFLTALIERFHLQNPQIDFEVYQAGSLQALGYARTGQADLIISHYPEEEKRLISQGFILKRTQFLFSKYAIFGPSGDPLKLAQKSSIVDVMKSIAEEEAPFLAPSPKGGTYRKIEALWALAGINPEWPDYQYTQLNSPATLKQAAQLNSYAIADMMVYLRNKDALGDKVVPLYQNDLTLRNIFSVLIVKNKNIIEKNHNQNILKFYDYLISNKGQEDIREIGKNIFNDTIVIPAAKFDAELSVLRKEEQLGNENRSLLIVIVFLALLLFVVLFVFYAYQKIQRSEKTRVREETRYRDLVESTSDWVWEIDENFIFSYVSPRVLKLLGYFPGDIVGLNFFELVKGNDNKSINVINERKPFTNLECLRIHKSGQVIYTEVSAIPILNEAQEFSGYRGIERDISERKSAEKENLRLQREIQQSYKMKSLGQLTGGVAHDFNNILAAILGYAGLSRSSGEKKGDKVLVNHMNKINKAGQRAKALIAQMLAFSRVDNSVERAIFFAPLIKEELVMLRSMLPASIIIKSEIADKLPPALLTPTQLQQIILNLAINARDAMHEKGTLLICLELRKNVNAECVVSHKNVRGDWLALSISDTGEGIDDAKINDIFNPFFTTKEVGKGTGLGLSIVYGILHGHGGHILIETVLGVGTTFSLLFHPHYEKENKKIDYVEDAKIVLKGNGEHVLIVDDELAIGEFIGELLSMHNYQVSVVGSAKEALSLFKQDNESFDLLITDQTMPGMTGIELIAELRLSRPDLKVIICSGFSELLDQQKAKEINASYIKKPIDNKKLLREVTILLGDIK